MDWDSVLQAEPRGVRAEYVEVDEIPPPVEGDKHADLVRYLETVFDASDHVSVCMRATKDGKVGKIEVGRTASEIIEHVKAGFPIEEMLGDMEQEHGAWIGINPVDGQGGRDSNVVAYRHALIQADDGDLGHQLAIIRKLELPCSCIIHSGGKSIHAIVKIDAANRTEYRDRVDYLHSLCKKSGLSVDGAHRYPSRLTRMPGVYRGIDPQYLIDGPCGMATWEEWHASMEDLHDTLPDIECLADTVDCRPELDPVIIDGVLRRGHKMLISGPSKSGKSWGLINLCLSVANGTPWFGFPVEQGRALYVNCEIARASALGRFDTVAVSAGIGKACMQHIDIWNIRANCCGMGELAPKLIRRAKERKGYSVIVVDPLYKVEEGDENAAHVMTQLFALFERVAGQTGSAIVYAHHHSKGDQGGKKAGDRGSGSGVILRDPDALLDLVELVTPQSRRDVLRDAVQLEALTAWLDEIGFDQSRIVGDASLTAAGMVQELHGKVDSAKLDAVTCAAAEKVRLMEGFRLEGTLREFAKFKPREFWFQFPLHVADRWDLLNDAKAAGEEAPWQVAQREKEASKKASKARQKADLERVVEAAGDGAKVADLMPLLGMTSPQGVRNAINKALKDKWIAKDGIIRKVE